MVARLQPTRAPLVIRPACRCVDVDGSSKALFWFTGGSQNNPGDGTTGTTAVVVAPSWWGSQAHTHTPEPTTCEPARLRSFLDHEKYRWLGQHSRPFCPIRGKQQASFSFSSPTTSSQFLSNPSSGRPTLLLQPLPESYLCETLSSFCCAH